MFPIFAQKNLHFQLLPLLIPGTLRHPIITIILDDGAGIHSAGEEIFDEFLVTENIIIVSISCTLPWSSRAQPHLQVVVNNGIMK